MEQQEDGDLSKWSDAFIAESADYTGDPEQFVQALQKYGWLDGKRIHDWIDYAKRYLESKYRTNNPQRLHEIWALYGKAYGKSDQGRIPDRPKVSLEIAPTEATAEKPRGFVKPTPDEVTAYAKSISFNLDGQYFCDYQEARGWRLKTGHIKDWKAVVRTWKVNNFTPAKPPEPKQTIRSAAEILKEKEALHGPIRSQSAF